MEEKNIKRLLKQYLLGQVNEQDSQAVDNWYQSFDTRQVILSEDDTAAAKEEIWNRIAPVTSEKRLPAAHRQRFPYLRVAAMIAIVAGALLAGYFISTKHHNNLAAFTTFSTGVGEKKRIVLEDSSVLTLDAGTTIRVQKNSTDSRRVEVADGQVFFNITKDPQRPFTVQSSGLTTTVLGTSFTVAAYKGIRNISIGVVSGKISVASNTTVLSVLEKDEQLVYNKAGRQYKKTALDEALTAWQEGRLLLNDLSFSEMAVVMQKNFGVTMQTTDDAVKRTKYTTELLNTMKPVEAAQVLAAIHHLKIKEAGNQIFLYK